jgi:hypothetical protein
VPLDGTSIRQPSQPLGVAGLRGTVRRFYIPAFIGTAPWRKSASIGRSLSHGPPSPPSFIDSAFVSIVLSGYRKRNYNALGIDKDRFAEPNYSRTQEIGAAVAFVGYDALIVPSARWQCENLILFGDNLSMDLNLHVLDYEEVDWLQWMRASGFSI